MSRRLLLVASVLVGFGVACAREQGTQIASTPAPEIEADGLARAQQQIAEREYRASENGQGLQAPNRAHDLRTYFDATGIRVHDRTAGGSPELLRLSLAGVGRGGLLAEAAPEAEVVATDNRVEIRRPGLLEWYVNSDAGLEQGFTLSERPEGQGALVVELAVAGARPALLGDAVVFETGAGRKLRYGELVAFDASQRPLAAHFEVASADRLRLVVDDTDAAYPVVIDPLLTETADTLLQPDDGDARLGTSVASAGDVNADGYADVIVGAPQYDAGDTNEGGAFVFLGSAAGIANGNPGTAAAQLESNLGGAALGTSVAGAGDVNGDGYADVIVGAPNYSAGLPQEGAAFVFLGGPSGIADGNPSTAAAQLESNQAGASLGRSVAGAGDVNGDGYADVIAGAPLYSAGELSEGAAFVFLGSASGIADGNPLTAAAQLESNLSHDPMLSANPEFGASVAGAGDVNGDGYGDVIVGAPGYEYEDEPQGERDEGAAFVFLGSASGVADGNPATAATELQANQYFAFLGTSVAGAGDVNGDGYGDVIVGAPEYTAGAPLAGEGAALVYLGSAAGIADGSPATAAALLESNEANAFLGMSVAGAGDVNGDGYADVIAGAPFWGATNSGAAFVFLGSAAGVADGNPTTAAAQLEPGQNGANFGIGVAGAGDVNGDGYADVMVGGPLYDSGETDEESAFVYLGGGTGIADGDATSAAARLETDQAGAAVSTDTASILTTAGAGDVNGDGYTDVIVGAPRYDNGESDEGAAFVFHGSPVGIPDGSPATAAAQLESNQPDANFGSSVAAAGDVNGDGFGDVIVGANRYHNPELDEGAAFVFHGSAVGIPDGSPATAAAQLESNQPDANFGSSVAAAGDVNGDGFGDVIVGAPGHDNVEPNEGAAFVFHGSAAGIPSGSSASANAQLEADLAGSVFGFAVDSAGDVNGDGYADVIVGASGYTTGIFAEGAAFVFHGSAAGIADGNASSADTELHATQGLFGYSVAKAGDVNGDGYGDVIVGAPVYIADEGVMGAAFIFQGSASGVADGSEATAATQLTATDVGSSQGSQALGVGVGSAGDLNGDGYADVIVSVVFFDPVQDVHGAAVFLGSASGVANGDTITAVARLRSSPSTGLVDRASVGSAGDVNGDGFGDLFVGAGHYANGQTDEGAALIFYGNRGVSGRPVQVRQRRGDGSGVRVQPWGGSHSTTGFAVELRAYHPQGSGRVRAEWEACPASLPFGHAGCTRAVFPGWISVNGAFPSILLSHTFTGLAEETLYRWRGRALHAPATGAIAANPAHGPWRRYQAQSVEADVRVVPEPGLVLSLASGAVLLAVLARRRGR